jgi:uncharacterized membrane protein YcaP (DUF421 family)
VFYDSVSGLVRVLVLAPLAYLWLIAVLRATGKRTLAQLNAFDFIVTVALGSTLASVILTKSVAWAEGALALALLAALQLIAALAAVHSSRASHLSTDGAAGGRAGPPGRAGPRADLPAESASGRP